jgi:carbonic anhydrase
MCDETRCAQHSRRNFLQTGVSLFALALAAPMRHVVAATASATPPVALTPDQALRRLRDGNARYAANQLDIKDFSAGRATRAKAQYPIAAILSCADSRVAPELIFDQGPGDLFVIRIAGNYLDIGVLASLEYAVKVLNVPLIMVLGHSDCGAVKATIGEIKQPSMLPGHIWDITDAVRPGVEKVVGSGGDNLLERAIESNVDYNVSRIASAQPILAEAVQHRRLRVVGGVYELASGKVQLSSTN